MSPDTSQRDRLCCRLMQYKFLSNELATSPNRHVPSVTVPKTMLSSKEHGVSLCRSLVIHLAWDLKIICDNSFSSLSSDTTDSSRMWSQETLYASSTRWHQLLWKIIKMMPFLFSTIFFPMFLLPTLMFNFWSLKLITTASYRTWRLSRGAYLSLMLLYHNIVSKLKLSNQECKSKVTNTSVRNQNYL